MAELVSRVRACSNRPGSRDFFSLLVSLSRGVDYALARNEVPSIVKDLPSIVKLAYQRKNDVCLLSATMMLMNSIQNACRRGWFDDTEVGEFNKLAKELYNNFSGRGESTIKPTVVRDVVSEVMPRFLPQFELGKILLSIEAKPGYEVLLADFLISKLSPPTANEKIRLLVVQIDNMETSSCIINPPDVNIMINGRGVENRTPGLMARGPQLPSDVTLMLVFGTNLLQVVGQFSGNYVIILAHMSPRLKSDFQVSKEKLHEYTSTKALEKTLSDDDIIEGSSKISLKCPISFKRMTTPVKGHSCRHRQCFDYDNYVEINTRRPSWRCPHCNQSVSFCDIRVDRKMVEVLSQVGDNVEDVFILADGSWRISSEDFSIDVPKKSYPLNQRVELDMQPDGIKLDKTMAQNEIVDLTLDDINNSAADFCVGNYDTKPLDDSWSGLLNNGLLHSSVSTFGSAMQASGYVPETCDDIWSRMEFLTGSAFNGGQNLGAPALASTTSYPGNRMSESFGVPHSSIFGMSSNPVSAMANTGFSSFSRAATLTSERTATHNSTPVVTEAVTPTFNRAATFISERPATHSSTSVVTEAVTTTLNRAVILPSERSATHNSTSVVTEAVFPALSRAATLTPIAPSIQTVERRPRGNPANSMQLMLQQQQEMQLLRQLHGISENSVANIDEARQRSLYPRHVARTPIAVQALPAQPLRYTASHQRPSRSVSHEMASSARGLSPTNTHAFASPITPVSNNTFNRRVTGTETPWTYSTASDQIVALPATNWGNVGLRSSISPPVSRVFIDNQQTPIHHQQTLNAQSVTPSNLSTLRQQSSRSSAPPSAYNSGRQQQQNQAIDPLPLQMLGASQMRVGASPGVGVHQATSSISAISMRPPPATETQLRNVSGVGHSGVEVQSGNASFPELPSDKNWQPTGLMRGSITGRSCSPAISQLMLQPSSSAATASETRLGGYAQRTD